jgi:2-hydroxy-6-oxonona-2,4-dienedioate hydrolase
VSIWTDLTPVPFELSFVDAGGIPTRSLRAGEGPAVVFLHGTSGHLEAFSRNVVPHVEAGLSVHAIDMLGHGYTGKPSYPYEIPRYVEHLLGYLDACGIDSAHLVGESLGGWVAAWLATEAPERVATLQLVAAGGTKANPTVMERIKTSTLEAVTKDDRDLTRRRLELLFYDGEHRVTEELVDVRHAIYHQPDFVANIGNLLCLQEMEIRTRNLLTPERLANIKAPTLVVWGHDNPFGDVPEARALHEAVAGSELLLFPECGHWPQWEQAERYNPLSIRFISAHPS